MVNSNYDPNELKKFALLANHWWDEHGELRTLHQINPLRMQFIETRCTLAGKQVLDVGCGGGILSESMSKAGAIVTGLDMDPAVIHVAKQHQKLTKQNNEYLCQSVEELAEAKPHHYDVITCMEMLEHVPDPKSILNACHQLIKTGGHLFFSTLNRNPKSYLFAIVAAEYILRLLPKNTHDYAKFIKPSELSQWLRNLGIEPIELEGISYQPFHKQFTLSKDISINYLLYARKE